MIHQCYFQEDQRAWLFDSPLYRGFGLYPEVNPDVTRNCPELANHDHLQQLNEYTAMLHHWRNPELDPDPWIGFTSYRQLEKFPAVLLERQTVELYLEDADILGWGVYEFVDGFSGRPVMLIEEAELCHPGFNSALWRLLMLHNEPMPTSYVLESAGLFCNYWIMSRANFNLYMQWSAPLILFALKHPDPFIRDNPRALGYLSERLFICWYGLQQKRIRTIGPSRRIVCANRLFQAHVSSNEAW